MKPTCQNCKNWHPQQAELEYSVFYGICTCAKWKFSTTGNADVVLLDRQNRHQVKHMGVQRFESQSDEVPFGVTEVSRYCLVTEENFGACILEKKKKEKYNTNKNGMIRVILESPFKGDVKRNKKYARKCVRHSLSLGEAPIASHLLYTQEGILDDNNEQERMWGINAGLEWKSVAEKHVFYVDFGMSSGMEYGMKYATDHHIPVEIRKILE